MALIRKHHYSLLRTSSTLESGSAERRCGQTGLCWPDQLDQDAGQKKPFEGPNLMPLELWPLTGIGPE